MTSQLIIRIVKEFIYYYYNIVLNYINESSYKIELGKCDYKGFLDNYCFILKDKTIAFAN